MDKNHLSPKDKSIKVRLSEEEFGLLEAAAKAAGFSNNSEYVRHMTIGDGKGIQVEMRDDIRKILEILQSYEK